MLKGVSLVAGDWIGSDRTLCNEPIDRAPDSFAAGTPELINRACQAAEDVFWTYGYGSADERAALLNEVATQIDARRGSSACLSDDLQDASRR